MKKERLQFFIIMIMGVMFTMVFRMQALSYPSGSPAGYTGSPGDGQHCVSCHGGSAATVSGWITSSIPPQGYTAGTLYNITVTVTGSGKKGFELSPQNVSGLQLGTLTAGSGNHLTGGTKYVTHNSAGSTSGTSIYNFSWTAPAAGTGTVTFYCACTVGKSNTKLTTLAVDENVAVPISAQASADPSLTCAGQNSQLNVIVSGGTGTYTFLWSSTPPGFSSTLQNPVVSPDVITLYSVHVDDGTGAVDASTQVTVNEQATAFAGNDTIFSPAITQVPLNGTATSYTSVTWTTSGSGTFSAATELTGNYFPSAADKTAGTVTLTLTVSAQAPCTASASSVRHVQFSPAIGMDDATGGLLILTISPNPSAGIFNLQVNGQDQKEVTFEISDLRGRMVLNRNRIVTGSPGEKIDMTGYPKGIYLVRVQTANESRVRKLVIE